MKLSVTTRGDMLVMVDDDIARIERSHTRAMRGLAQALKADWRDEIRSAGMGNRLANSIRSEAYPQKSESVNAAVLIWTTAGKILASHDQGGVIRAADGFWLAIPLPSAGKARYGRKMTPKVWEQRNGQELRYVHRPGRPALLVADDARVSKHGKAKRKGGRRRKDGVLSGAQTVPVFVLVPQVKLRKRTDLLTRAQEATDRALAALGADLED